VRPLPDPAWIHTELRRAGVTLEQPVARKLLADHSKENLDQASP
jgi:hypothetical protein